MCVLPKTFSFEQYLSKCGRSGQLRSQVNKSGMCLSSFNSLTISLFCLSSTKTGRCPSLIFAARITQTAASMNGNGWQKTGCENYLKECSNQRAKENDGGHLNRYAQSNRPRNLYSTPCRFKKNSTLLKTHLAFVNFCSRNSTPILPCLENKAILRLAHRGTSVLPGRWSC